MKLEFEYGQGLVGAELPDSTDIFIPGETVADPPCLPQDWDSLYAATLASIRNPIGMPPLKELAGPGKATLALNLVGTLADGRVMDAVPKLMNEAETLGGPQCDNMTLIAMTWHDDQQEDIPDTVSTRTMPADAYTTQMEGFGRSKRDQEDLSEDEIERAIREINAAIHKFK